MNEFCIFLLDKNHVKQRSAKLFFPYCLDSAVKQKGDGPKMGFEFDRFEKRRGQKDDRKSKAVKSIFKVNTELTRG